MSSVVRTKVANCEIHIAISASQAIAEPVNDGRYTVRHQWTGLGGRRPLQSLAPGFGEKYWSLSGFPSHSLESGGGAFLRVIFGQVLAYSAFSDSHFSAPGSVSGLIAVVSIGGRNTLS
jgi:hypothetical protein